MSTDPRLLDLFAEGSALATEARAAWLRELTAREPALAGELASLLAAGDRRRTLLDVPAVDRLRAPEDIAEPGREPKLDAADYAVCARSVVVLRKERS